MVRGLIRLGTSVDGALPRLCCVFVFLFASASPLMAKEISVKSKPNLTLEGNVTSQRVCYYEGRSYSLGAVIAIGDVLLECQPEKHFETNGALMWVRLEKTS